jgi:hypothetical protein
MTIRLRVRVGGSVSNVSTRSADLLGEADLNARKDCAVRHDRDD